MVWVHYLVLASTVCTLLPLLVPRSDDVDTGFANPNQAYLRPNVDDDDNPGYEPKPVIDTNPRLNETFNKLKPRLDHALVRRNLPNDPLFSEQWHLSNGIGTNDINVTGVWTNYGILGEGVTVAVVDTGVDANHPDIQPRLNAEGSYNFLEDVDDPTPPGSGDEHGTRCAGIVAAEANDVCGVGVAFRAQLSGIRIFSTATGRSLPARQKARALLYRNDINQVYSCSFGPPDTGYNLLPMEADVQRAIVLSCLDGRDGKGNIYVFAAGNGGRLGDLCNFDGYANLIWTMAIGAIDDKNIMPEWAELCSALMAVSYGAGGIRTTDMGGGCSLTFSGTLALTPMVLGMIALALAANPNLSWRDVFWLVALTAVPINTDDGTWQDTGLGKPYSQKYGFGKVDAGALVDRAISWDNVNPHAWIHSDFDYPENTDLDTDIVRTITITADDVRVSNFGRVEQVTVWIWLRTEVRGETRVMLEGPLGVISELAQERVDDQNLRGFRGWNFTTMQFWGLQAEGEWKLHVKLGADVDLRWWNVNLWGEAASDTNARFDLDRNYTWERNQLLRGRDPSGSVSIVSRISEANTLSFSTSDPSLGQDKSLNGVVARQISWWTQMISSWVMLLLI